MTQSQLNREVAKATGESVSLIRSIGFNVVVVPRFVPQPRRNGGQGRARRQRRQQRVLQTNAA